MKIGIVGHGKDKFNSRTEFIAKKLILLALTEHEGSVLVSGHSPVGGIDIWSEEVAEALHLPMDIKAPKNNSWDGEYGYKARNLDIARCSDILYVIVVAKYPETYRGRKFDECYHCTKHKDEEIPDHVKSGGCWTGWEAAKLGKHVIWHVIK
jgi:hypothetical protein